MKFTEKFANFIKTSGLGQEHPGKKYFGKYLEKWFHYLYQKFSGFLNIRFNARTSRKEIFWKIFGKLVSPPDIPSYGSQGHFIRGDFLWAG